MNKWATKESFFKVPVPHEIVEIVGVGGVKVYGLSVGERDEYENDVYTVRPGSREVVMENARALMVIRTVRDQHGKPLFGPGDIGKVLEMPANVVEKLYHKGRELSGMPVTDLDGLVKNYEPTSDPDSGTGSPDISK